MDAGGLIDHLSSFGKEFLAGFEVAANDLQIVTLDVVGKGSDGCAKTGVDVRDRSNRPCARHLRSALRAETRGVLNLRTTIRAIGHKNECY